LPGWRRAVLDLSGGTRGCTHVNTLLVGLAEMQAMVVFLEMNERAPYALNWSHRWFRPGRGAAPDDVADVFVEIFLHGLVCRVPQPCIRPAHAQLPK
jgi:Protein of unknown function (DUF2889)